MSTDPSDFAHPIDEPSPQEVEAAARGLFERDYDPNSQMAWEEISEDARDRHRAEAVFALIPAAKVRSA